MQTRAIQRGDSLYIYLTGELDEHSVAGARAEADGYIDRCAGLSRAVFNLAGVKFMDSTGIGFLIGRYKRLKRYGMQSEAARVYDFERICRTVILIQAFLQSSPYPAIPVGGDKKYFFVSKFRGIAVMYDFLFAYPVQPFPGAYPYCPQRVFCNGCDLVRG